MHSNDLEEAIPRWNFELGLAAAFLPEDPLNALAWTQRIEGEIEAQMARGPEAGEQLGQLRGEAHSLYEESYASSRRFLEASERRHDEFAAREQAVFTHPLKTLRRPF